MTGETCVVGPGPGNTGNVAACVSNIMACNTQADCPSPLACAADYRCRNLCTSAADCNVLGITGDVCAEDAQGVHYCAAMADVTAEDGGGDAGTIYVITEMPPTGYTGTVTEPTGLVDGGHSDATTGGGSSSSGGGSSGGSGGSSGGSSGGAAACNAQNCSTGHQCTDAGCVACGAAAGDPCCGTACGTNLTCTSAGMCACGGPTEECCNGTTCNNGVTCTGGICACGAAGTVCAPRAARRRAWALCSARASIARAR